MVKLKMLWAAALLSGIAALLPVGTAQAQGVGVQLGQDGIQVQYDEKYRRGRLAVRPGEAEIGQRVTLIGRDLPPGVRLVVVAGRNPARLSRIQTVRVDAQGRVNLRVAVPEWARVGRNLFFALQTPGGRILAQAQPIRVLDLGDDDDEQITVTGELLSPIATCPRLAGDDGRIYALTGSLRQFETGDRVRVTGELAEASICNQRRTIEVERIRSAE
jgi:hypothetical protein